MRWIDLVHRWAGGTIGLLLAMMGLTGTILIWKTAWIGLPHAEDAATRNPALLAATTARLLAHAGGGASIVYADRDFGLDQLRLAPDAGAYADRSGAIVARWSNAWQRPELWISDLHEHLLAGDVGETVVGIVGLATMLFVVTGTLLWFRTRRTFRVRLWPRRPTRTAILMHHRDLGIVVAPLLLMSGLTGAMMVFRPFALGLVAPLSSPASVTAAMATPKIASAPLAPSPDWAGMMRTAHAHFPDAAFRVVTLPRKTGEPITIRMKRAAEWLPNGRTMLWFDAGSGRLLGQRDALAAPRGAQILNAMFPVHAAKIAGPAYRVLMTGSGLAMLMLGTLTMWTFWFKRPKPAPR